MEWKALLRGHDFDLDTLVRLFSNGEDVAVLRGEQGVYLQSDKIDAETEVQGRKKAANEVLRMLNGLGRVEAVDFRPVELTGAFEDSTGTFREILLEDTAELRSRATVTATGVVSGGEAEPPQDPPKATLPLAAAEADPDVAEVLRILGSPTGLDFVTLYKVYEIVRHNDAQGLNGYASQADLTAFTASANRPDVSGDDARHARTKGGQPKRTMTLPEAREFIRGLVENWLNSKT